MTSFRRSPAHGLLAGLALTGSLLAGCQRAAAPVPAAAINVGIYVVRPRPVNLLFDLPGRTSAVQVAEVRPQVSGIIKRRMFREGSDVEAGQQLYQIDSAPYQAVFDKAAAAQVSADLLVRRYTPLTAAHAVSRQQYDDALSIAREDRAEVEAARINLRYTRMLAPISGRIGRSSVTAGALVTDAQAAPLATITQLDPIYVDVTESSDDLLRLRKELAAGQLRQAADGGARVSLTLEDGSQYAGSGELQFSEVTVDQGTGMVTLRAIFPNPQKVLLPGMFVHAQIDEGTVAHGLLVPQAGLQRDSAGRAYVWTPDRAGKARQQWVDAERMVGQNWLVSGLSPGEKVIVQGLQGLRPGAAVHVVPLQSDDPSVTLHTSTNDPVAQ